MAAHAILLLAMGTAGIAGTVSAQSLVPGPELGLMSLSVNVEPKYIAALADGRVIVGGKFTAIDGYPRPGVALLNADGTLVPNWPAAPVARPPGYLGAGLYDVLANDDNYAYFSSYAGGEVKRISIATGLVDPAWPAQPVYGARAILSGQWLYVIGDSYSVRRYDRETGTQDAWIVSANFYIEDLAVDGNAVYVVGSFSQVVGSSQRYAAKVDAQTGALVTAWNPVLDNSAGRVTVSSDAVFLAGSFTTINGQTRRSMVKLDKTTGAVITDWQSPSSITCCFTELVVEDGVLYFGSQSSIVVDGQTMNRVGRMSAATGAAILPLLPGADDAVRGIAKRGNSLYVVGEFNQLGGQTQRRIGKIDLTSAAVDATFSPLPGFTAQGRLHAQPDGTYIVSGKFTHSYRTPRSSLLKLSSSFQVDPLWAPNASHAFSAGTIDLVVPAADGIYIAGSFFYVNGQQRENIAKLNNTDGAPLPWVASEYVSTVRDLGAMGGHVYVAQSSGIRRFSATTGTFDAAWNPNPYLSGARNIVLVDDGVIVSSYSFTTGAQKYLIKANLVDGAPVPGWDPAPNSNVTYMMRDGDTLIIGGFSGIGGIPRTVPARINIHTGQLDTAWTPAKSGPYIRSGPDLFSYDPLITKALHMLDPVTGAEDACWTTPWVLPPLLANPTEFTDTKAAFFGVPEGIMLSGVFVNAQSIEVQGFATMSVAPKLAIKSTGGVTLTVGSPISIELEAQDRAGAPYMLPATVNVSVTHDGPGVLNGNANGQIGIGQSATVLGPLSYSTPVSELTFTASSSGGTPLRSCKVKRAIVKAFANFVLTPNRNPALSGSSVTITATVSAYGSLGLPSGSLTFERNGVSIPGCVNVPWNNGSAQCNAGALPEGDHLIRAAYAGDTYYATQAITYTQRMRNTVGVARNDATGNGTSDLIWYHAGAFGVIGMNANGLALDPYYAIDVQSDANWKIVGLGDLNDDGRSDLVWYNSATGEAYGLLLNGGTLISEGRIHLEPNLDWKPEQIADVNGDGRADIVWKNQATGSVFVMLMNGLAQSGGQVVYTEPNLNWKIMASGDMNGDGRADLLWRNVATGDVFSMLMDGFSVIGGGVIYTEPNLNWKIIGLADYNADGRADVLWQNTATGDVFEMQMNGTTVSAGQVIYNEPNTQWKIVALGDYNGDGRADILWQNTVTGQVYMMLMNGFAITGANFVYTEPDTQWQIVGP